MKRHLSFLGFLAQSTIYKVILVLIIMAAVQFVWFYLALRGSLLDLYLEDVISGGLGLLPVATVAFAVILFLLCRTGANFGSKSGYTYRRLSISLKAAFFWQCLYNCLVILLAWAVQVVIAVGLCRFFMEWIDAGPLRSQEVFLVFYRNDFLHNLLPLDELWSWIRNGVLVVGLGTLTASAAFRSHNGGFAWGLIPMAAITFATSFNEVGDMQERGVVIFLVGAILFVNGVRKGLFTNEE